MSSQVPMGGNSTEAPGAPASATGTQVGGRTRDVLLIGLTLAAGVVDAVSYLGLGQIFTANMTGNVVFLALAVGERSVGTAVRSVGALVGFSVGAVVAGRFLHRPRPPGVWPRQVTWLLWGQLACMTAFASVWASTGGRPDAATLYVLIGLSSLGMGIQNAAARHLAVPGLTTTVITGALTSFMVDLPALGISGLAQRKAAWAVLALFGGAAVGAILMVYARIFAPFVTVATVATVASVASLVFGLSKQGSG
jgi:uncharacterized membrane protein YoaK (UPF0700 family)